MQPLVLGAVLGIDGPGERAGRRETERPDDAGGVDQILQGRPDLHDHDGLGAGPGERGVPPPGRECELLGAGMERRIPARAKVDLVGPYVPVPFGFGGYQKGLRPADFR